MPEQPPTWLTTHKKAARASFAIETVKKMMDLGFPVPWRWDGPPDEHSAIRLIWKLAAKEAKRRGIYSRKTYVGDAAMSLQRLAQMLCEPSEEQSCA